jgi:hypothetical protein
MKITKHDFLQECKEIDAQIEELKQSKKDLQARWVLQEAAFKVGDIVNVWFKGTLAPEKLYIYKVGLYSGYGMEKEAKVEYSFKKLKSNGEPSLNSFFCVSDIEKIELI